MSNITFGSLLALVIGIDTYAAQSVTPLLGAVADAQAIEHYLVETLGVPLANITTLLNEQATRANIIKELEQLAVNPAIGQWDPKSGRYVKGDISSDLPDPILIFFAGHGREAPAPEGWGAHRARLQMIVPHDYGTQILDEGKPSKMEAIPDRSINILLRNVANAKGNNIVVIFDCCHSGSGTRYAYRRVRCVGVTEAVPEDLDYGIWGMSAEMNTEEGEENALAAQNEVEIETEWTGEGQKTAKQPRADTSGEYRYYGDASHVLLAACASNQKAMEDNRRGAFTKALLDTMIKFGIKKMSYAHLIKHLPQLPGQTPRCEGLYRNRMLFSMEEVKAEPFYEVKEIELYKGSIYHVLQAGGFHGITTGSEFSLHIERDRNSTHLGNFSIDSIDDLESAVQFPGGPPQYLPMPAFAEQTVFGEMKPLRLHLSNDSRLDYLRTRLEHEIIKYPHLYAMDDREKADFEIMADGDGDTASFAFVNSHIETLGLKRLPFRVSLKQEADEIFVNVIDAASMFNRFLTYQPLGVDEHEALPSGEPASVHFTRLKPSGKKWGPLEPVSGKSNLNLNNQVDLVSGEDILGLEIRNNTNEGFYPYLFLFNCNELTIESWYTSQTTKEADNDAPLQPKGRMTIGYNAGPGRPWMHVVKPAEIVAEGKIFRDAEDMQVEFFKLILTTQPVDFEFMTRTTPFHERPRAVPLPIPIEMRQAVLITVITRGKEEIGASD
ncbi:hypothetical protein FRC17_008638 [Serendipita sp. 399]|nr:hypothetical protein FRC17_008638 [Serendipita sp. 399]